VLLGAIALVLGIAYTAIVLLRRPELGPAPCCDVSRLERLSTGGR
jgi:hypothetical protein